ncbi:thioredoxin family protein [Bdellovibrio sp. 22V]|uniref:thioredoxin family protein n=1 Tax=Bdellovibrio TaxID=958 RepID=UPI002543B0C6|nr:thioredoxin family protein [Bdellovibrio sp. 22V]WII73499.1 thioredoxin family protein [Bdellovibrio sp. 22V]
MKIVVSLALFFASVSALARLSDGKVNLNIQKKILVASVAPGFHFNKEAPAHLTVMDKESAPLKKEEKEMSFDLNGIGGKTFSVSFYVCDDKKTVCEEHKYDHVLKNGKLVAAKTEAAATKASLTPSTQNKSVKEHLNAHGFIENDLAAALAKAKKENKLVFVDYGAPWCPACVRYETETFNTKTFKNAAKSLVKLALNADLAQNKDFGDKYKIKALPTILILNAQGEELYRMLDFKPADLLVKELKQALLQKTAMADLQKKAEQGDKSAISLLAEHASNSLQYEEAVKWYAKRGEASEEYANAEIMLWAQKFEEDPKNKEKYIATLQKWIAQYPNSYTAISARNDWAEIYKDEKSFPESVKNELAKNIQILSEVAVSNEKSVALFKDWGVSSYAPFEQVDLLSQWFSSAKYLKKDTEAKEIQGKLQALLKKHPFTVQRPGEIMTAAAYFRKAELTKEEGDWLLKLVEKYPDTYVYHARLASYYKRQKDYAKALPEAEKAVELGADLRFFYLKTLAEIQKELNQKEAARKSIEQALALPEAKNEKYKSVAQALEEMKKSL